MITNDVIKNVYYHMMSHLGVIDHHAIKTMNL